jgi:hypothetical protein
MHYTLLLFYLNFILCVLSTLDVTQAQTQLQGIELLNFKYRVIDASLRQINREHRAVVRGIWGGNAPVF